jgi:hypothetical protein
MNRKEILLKIGLFPSFLFFVSLVVFIFPFFRNWFFDRNTSAFEIILSGLFNNGYYYYVYVDAQVLSWLIFTFFLISLLIFLRFMRLSKNFLGFPSIPEAKQFYLEKKLLEKKKRLLQAKLSHKERMLRLEEEKKKYL